MDRKNFLFANTPAGAQSSAAIYSIITLVVSGMEVGELFTDDKRIEGTLEQMPDDAAAGLM